ncbi:MAG: M28 family peptidase [Acidobacteriaceae bacterium]|nr:M28 family peptidase [Acidobacteriaceae bacterium]
MRRLFSIAPAALLGCALFAQSAIAPGAQRALRSITAANLRGDLSFLASDALEGRYTPSPGLEVAAEFIASQFRAAGLEPGGDNDYFQTAEMVDRRMGKAQSEMTVVSGGGTFQIPASAIAVSDANEGGRLENTPAVVFRARDPEALKGAEVSGKAVIAPAIDWRKIPAGERQSIYTKMRAFDGQVASLKPAVEILVTAGGLPTNAASLIAADEASQPRVTKLLAQSDELRKWMEKPSAASGAQSVSVAFSRPDDRRVRVKNVVGILRGSDARLKDTYVLLTAHYDHIGTRATAAGAANPEAKQNGSDEIFNGANDDGSGTVSVIEIGRALAKLNPHPRRTIVFMTFFGEERGELGSQFYGKHPVVPVKDTIADINLEQVGRTDSTVGKQINNASLTGYDYSDVTKFLERAGRETGIKLYMDKDASDAYFTRSDNASLAEQGVPAHSLTVAFDYPDYHGVGDEWQKVDYDNMARVDRMVALGLMEIANSARAPEWNAQNPKTAPFREAQRKLLGQ